MAVLIIGISASLYVHAQQSTIENDIDSVIINGIEFQTKDFFNKISIKTIETNDGEKTGIPLDEMLQYAGISCISCHEYTFKASDGYQQSVTWEHISKGVFTDEKSIFFPDLARTFWVINIIEVKVN
ncbi:MAG: hypothetical protein DRN27_02305 [Thermoplasmata archaeon]|nr:MAG: hypothetical protein DRN27_02305 [Thermoplasmata archaeon]